MRSVMDPPSIGLLERRGTPPSTEHVMERFERLMQDAEDSLRGPWSGTIEEVSMSAPDADETLEPDPGLREQIETEDVPPDAEPEAL